VISKAFRLSVWTILVSLACAQPVRISPPQAKTAVQQPDVRESAAVVDSKGVVHVAFQAFSVERKRSVVMYARIAPGERAAHSEPLTTSAPGVLPDLIWSKGRLLAVWSEKAGEGGSIAFASSDDNGKTWEKSVLPVRTDLPTAARVIVANTGHIFVYGSARVADLGAENEIYCLRSTDGGKSWTNASPSLDIQGESVQPFLMEVSPSHLVMGWTQTDRRSWKVMIRQSKNGGQTWEPSEVVNDDPKLPVAQPRPVAVGDRLVVLWTETTAFGKRLVADSFEKGAWGKDRVLSGQEVTEVHYAVLSTAKEAQVAYLTKSGSGQLRRYRLYTLQLDPGKLSGSKPLAPPEMVNESFYAINFAPVNLKSGFAVGASYRVSSLMWKISLFSGEKKRSSGDILRLAPDLGGRDRALLHLLPLPDGLVVLYREQPVRQATTRYSGEVWLERVRVPK